MGLFKRMKKRSIRSAISVRVQIMIGFGFVLALTLIVAVIGIVNLRTLQDGAEEAIETSGQIRVLSLQISNEFLAARQSETAFINEWRSKGLSSTSVEHTMTNQQHLAKARESLAELDTLVRTSSDPLLQPLLEQTALLPPLLDEYAAAFQRAVDLTVERSYAQAADDRLRTFMDQLEVDVRKLDDPEYYRLITQVRNAERSYFATGEQQFVDVNRLSTGRFLRLVEDSESADLIADGVQLNSAVMIQRIKSYEENFNQLVTLESQFRFNTLVFRDAMNDITEITDEIGDAGEATFQQARDELGELSRRSGTALFAASVIALSIGSIGAYLLGQQITRPLQRLSEAAEQIKQGDLQQHVTVSGGEELVNLAESFNSMAAQLGQILGQLEQRVQDRTRALEASGNVSRTLSTILDPDQLVSEVVELVRAAFDYYHAHIYLLDAQKANLVMAGGTGQAGRAMLGKGHSIPIGKGLVGRAAKNNQIVLVPDVTVEEGWLPNPLLPETRSEVAVPISIGTEVLGVLDVQHDVADDLTEEDAQLLQSVANQVAIGLRNASQYQRAQQRAERESQTAAISQKIQGAESVQDVLRIAAQELGQALGTERAAVQIRVKENQWRSGKAN